MTPFTVHLANATLAQRPRSSRLGSFIAGFFAGLPLGALIIACLR